MMTSVFFLSLMNGSAWGGSEEIWYRTALWMCKNNYKVGIGCYDWKEKQYRINQLKDGGCDIYLLPNKKGLFKKWAIKKALGAIPFAKYDITVVNQGGWEEILHAPFKHLYTRLSNYVIISHNYNENAVLSLQKQQLLQQWVLHAQMNFAASEKIFEVIKKKFNISIDKKAILINPITFQPELSPAPYPVLINNSFIWIMLAELDIARKAQDILIETLASAKWKGRNWQLHLYGKGKDQLLLQNLVNDLGLANKVILKGFTNNIKQTLQDCHMLFQCTHIDAMPISVVEAMAMARPCFVSNVGDMPRWVEHNKNGFVCPAVNVSEIDIALENCWQQKENWQRFGVNAFSVFSQKYPIPYEEKMAEILTQFILKTPR